MSDQMPDEVWLGDKQHRTWPAWTKEDADNLYRRTRMESTRYIRADLYDAKPCPHVVGEITQHCTLAQDEVRRLTQRAEQAEAERDRLRAAMEAAIAVLRNDLYTTRVREALARLQEALGHE